MVGIRRLAIIFVLWAPLLVKVDAARKIPDGLLREYYPSFCQSAASPAPSCKFVIFREGRQTTSIVLPFHLEWLAYSRNDRVLYTLSPSTKPVCVDRVDLNPVQLTTAVCPAGLTAVFAFAVSADAAQALISGQIKENGNVRCGVFEIRIADGEVRQVLSAEDCRTYNYERSWTSLSFAHDSSRALALRMNRLELFEIGKVGTRSIAAEVRMAEWSSDGRWIAAIDRHDKT